MRSRRTSRGRTLVKLPKWMVASAAPIATMSRERASILGGVLLEMRESTSGRLSRGAWSQAELGYSPSVAVVVHDGRCATCVGDDEERDADDLPECDCTTTTLALGACA